MELHKMPPVEFRVGNKVLDVNGLQGEITEIVVRDGKPVLKVLSKMAGLPCPISGDYAPEQLRKIVN